MSTDLATPPRRGSSVKWSVPEGWIGAAIAESDFGTAPAIVDALHEAVNRQALTYLPDALADAAIEATAAFLRQRHGWVVDPRMIHLVPDVLTALRTTLQVFMPAKTPVLVPTPAYPPFLQVPMQDGHEVVQIPSTRGTDGIWRIDVDRLDAVLTQRGNGLLMLCNPHNPLGHVAAVDEMHAIARVIDRHGARVFADEIHSPIVYPGSRHTPYASLNATTASHTITATSISKGWNAPGLKCAQVILSSELDQTRWNALDLAPARWGSVLGAVATTAAYTDGVAWLDETVLRLQENRDLLGALLREYLPSVTWTPPDATYLAWLDFGDAPEWRAAAEQLRRAHLDTVPGENCGAGLGRYVRFNFALGPDLLVESVHRVATVVKATLNP